MLQIFRPPTSIFFIHIHTKMEKGWTLVSEGTRPAGVSVMVTEYGKHNMNTISKYFNSIDLTISSQYLKSLTPKPLPSTVVTILEITSSSINTLALVEKAISDLNQVLPGSVSLYHGFN